LKRAPRDRGHLAIADGAGFSASTRLGHGNDAEPAAPEIEGV
jgi:hypothetical protein